MMRYTALLMAVSTLALAQLARADDSENLCASAAQERRGADVRAICEQARRWIALFKAGDIDGLMSLYTPDAQVALHGQAKLTGSNAIRAYFAPALAAKRDVEFLLHVEDIRVYGDVAYLLSRYWYRSVKDGEPTYQDAGRSLLIYRRDATGPWRIHVDIDQATPDVTFPPPPTAE
ncbi:MAG: SgcJ/EcaC family oxidoreductase [Steroidobacteraceae bacterium]